MFEFLRLKRAQDNQAADSYYRALKAFQIDPNQDFIKVKQREGMDAAVSYANLFFNNQGPLKRLRKEIELHAHENNPANKNCDVLVVMPPHGSLHSQVIENMQSQCMALALTGGFAHVGLARLNSDNALEGARRLTRHITEKVNQGRQVILVSYSYGSAFVRIMLDNLDKQEKSHIKGWLNISGLISGSPRFHCSDKKQLFSKMTLAKRSFSSEQTYFRGKIQTDGIRTVHILGLKVSETMSAGELKAREFLSAWGPNDGLVPLKDYQRINQPVVPLMNQGHGVNLSSMGSTFVRILSSMVSTVPMKENRPFIQATIKQEFQES